METPRESIASLTSNVLLLRKDINNVLAAKQEILLRMQNRTSTPTDLRNFIILSRRVISTLERIRQTIEKINEYYEENEPQNTQIKKYWSYTLEATELEIEANKSSLDSFLNGSSQAKADELFQQAQVALQKASNAKSPGNQTQKTDYLPELAQEFFNAPGSYETLVLGKFMRYDGTELVLPNCGINSFHTLEAYREKFERDLVPIIQATFRSTVSIKIRVLASIHRSNPKVLEVLHKAIKTEEAKTKKAEEIRSQLKKIQQRTMLPVTIDKQLETDLLSLDKLHAELKQIMLDANQTASELKALIN